MPERRWDSVSAFYAERGGLLSGELDCGVWWRGEGDVWRISVVANTGDVFAVAARGHQVRLLATLDGAWPPDEPVPTRGRPECYRLMDEIADEEWYAMCGQPGSLAWAAGRLTECSSRRT